MLHVVATPLGNLGDITVRSLEIFRGADLVACEDTRRTRVLFSHYGISCPGMLSYREGNEQRAGRRILEALGDGLEVVLCSDGGTPSISDPGYRLLRMLVAEARNFNVLPGPTAVTAALLYSGLPTSSFTFKGFPPRKPGPRRRFFAEEAETRHTLVIFESPFRVEATLRAALEALGDREAAVCLEMTKRFERVRRGYISDLLEETAGTVPKGEVTMVFAGAHPDFTRGTGKV